MNSGLLWFLGLAIIALTQALVLAMKLNQAKASKRNNPGKYGERIAMLETEVKNIKEDIKEINRKLDRK